MMYLSKCSRFLCLVGVIFHTTMVFSELLAQISQSPAYIFKYDAIFSQSVIRLSNDFASSFSLDNSYVQAFYYNLNHDIRSENYGYPLHVTTTYWNEKNNQFEQLELLDDGAHFDNDQDDGIFGNFILANVDQLIVEQTIIDVHFDSISINYHSFEPPIDYIPNPPIIISPELNSSVSTTKPIILAKMDSKINGFGIILLDKRPIFGKNNESVLWAKKDDGKSGTTIEEMIPKNLNHGSEYHLLLWCVSNSEYGDIIKESYSLGWTSFSIDTNIHNNIEFQIMPNFPNPCREETIITWLQSIEGRITFKLYNILGQEVIQLADNIYLKGHHFLIWNCRDKHDQMLSSGIYLLVANFSNKQYVSKLEILH